MNKLNVDEFITFKSRGDKIDVIMYYEFNTIVELIHAFHYKLEVVKIVHNLRKGLINESRLLYHKLMVEAVADHVGYKWPRYGE